MARPTASRLGTWSWPLRRLGRGLLWLYWVACVAVIAAGAWKVWPVAETRAAALAPPPTFAAPAVRFPDCQAAHRAGVYDIPAGSAAYNPRQDGDGDGFACETYPGDPYADRRFWRG